LKNNYVKSTLEATVNLQIKESELLAHHTSFGIGGPAAFYVEVSEPDDLVSLLKATRILNIPRLIIGGGTNLLVSDLGFDGVVIRTGFNGIKISGDQRSVKVGASVKSAALVEYLVVEGLAGLEFAAGLPGTIGGAITGNAGCFGSSLGERLTEAVVVFSDGSPQKIVDNTWFDFGYRRSALHDIGAVIVEATFAIEPGDAAHLQEISAGHIETRKTKHPSLAVKTAGSYFKNLPAPKFAQRRVAAGSFLDQIGAKQMSVGDAAVFEKHANIVINKGSARAADVLLLTSQMAKKVKDTFGVVLEPEVRFVGEKP